MNFDATEFLTEEQKSEIGSRVYEKMLAAIEAMEIKVSPINLGKIISDDLQILVQHGDGFITHEDMEGVGAAVGKALAAKVQEVFKQEPMK